MKRLLPALAIVIAFAAVTSFAAPCFAADLDGQAAFDAEMEKKKVTVDKEKVYLGSPSNFRKAAVVDLGKIFKETEAYKEIQREKLTKDDPKYRLLIVQANKTAKKAMAKLRDEQGYDLIVEKGHLKIEGEDVPDITSEVIEAVEN